MGYRQHETVYTGNSLESAPTTARVRFYDANTGLLEFANISGVALQAGDLVFGSDSGHSARLLSFSNNVATLSNVQPWDTTHMIVLDDYSHVALDSHFDGTDSQDYQQDRIVTV